jgi:hypothetical protein
MCECRFRVRMKRKRNGARSVDKRPCDQRNTTAFFFQPRPRLDCPADSIIFQAKEIELSTGVPKGSYSVWQAYETYRADDMSLKPFNEIEK